MFKKLAALMLALFTFAAFAAVDVNKATQAELDGIKGIGPGIAGKILDERKKGSFKDWGDLVERVNGVGEVNAGKFSAEGLTVNGKTFKGVAAKPVAKEAKPAAAEKAAAKAEKEAMPAAAAKAEKPAKAEKAEKVAKVKDAAKKAANDDSAKPMKAVAGEKK